jgi:hypothetical protein
VPRVSVASGDNGAPVFPANSDEPMVTGGAPEPRESSGTKKWRRGHLGLPESWNQGGRCADLRRKIPVPWQRRRFRFGRGKIEEKEENKRRQFGGRSGSGGSGERSGNGRGIVASVSSGGRNGGRRRCRQVGSTG